MSNQNSAAVGLENKTYVASNITISGGNGGEICIPSATVSFFPLNDNRLDIKKIIYNQRTTIVYWSDGTKSISTASIGEIFDEEIGLAVCLLKKMYGRKVRGKKLYKKMIERAERH